MRINKLPKSQVKALENAFRKSKDTREKIRFQALWLSARGYKRKEVAQITSSGESSIRHWITAYNKRSIGGLKSKPQTSHNYKLTQEHLIVLGLLGIPPFNELFGFSSDKNDEDEGEQEEEDEMKDRRPDYPNCVMTPGVIRGVQERQRAWDKKHPNCKCGNPRMDESEFCKDCI